MKFLPILPSNSSLLLEAPCDSNMDCLSDACLLHIFTYLDPWSLVTASRVCRKFYHTAQAECLWQHLALSRLTAVYSSLSPSPLRSWKAVYRVADNWCHDNYKESVFLSLPLSKHFCPRLLLHNSNRHLYAAYGDHVHLFSADKLALEPRRKPDYVTFRSASVNGFILLGDALYTYGDDGCVRGYRYSKRGRDLLPFVVERYHENKIYCADAASELFVSWSRSGLLRVHSRLSHLSLCATAVRDTLWKIRIHSGERSFFTGGTGNLWPDVREAALRLWDLNTGQFVVNFRSDVEENERGGCGVNDIKVESESTLLTCGHDSAIRLWDVRMGSCVSCWEDPHGSSVYCVVL